MDGVHSFALRLPRHAFSPRQVARPGEVWRVFQEAAVQASAACGWPPQRYLDEGVAFVVTSMNAVHHREIRYGQELRVRTWLRDFRRGVLTKREVRLEDEQGPIAATTQQWAHVAATDAGFAPSPASPALIGAFIARDDLGPVVSLPALTDKLGEQPEHRLEFDCWQTWMDPLNHANHPVYVDWADEAVARIALARGLDPQAIVPRAERVAWKAGVEAGDRVRVLTRLAGFVDRACVFRHRIEGSEGQLFARATTVRELPGLGRPPSG
jgi:acyl-CoA thioesterase FadM